MKRILQLLGLTWFSTTTVALVMAAWIAVIVASGAGWNLLKIRWDFSNPGAFGDSFGPLSALMASIAAVSAIAAYRSQAAEVQRLQARQTVDDELSANQRARSLAREEELDNRIQKTTFEGTFFRLLDSFRSIVSHIDIRTSQGTTKSAQDAFQSILYFTESSSNAAQGNIREAWRAVIARYANDLNHYFRFMYHIVRFVHESDTHGKYFYVRLLRAMLSESEIVLLGLNCEYGEGEEKFKPLVEQYALLHNISPAAKLKWFGSTVLDGSAFQSSDSV